MKNAHPTDAVNQRKHRTDQHREITLPPCTTQSFVPPCPENEILTRFGPGVSTSDTLSDSSSTFFLLFFDAFPILGATLCLGFSTTVGVDAAVAGVEASCCSCP